MDEVDEGSWIDRHKLQGGADEAVKRVRFCLDALEKAGHFAKGIDWGTRLTPQLTVEEVVGALVAAEQALGSARAYERTED